MKFSNSKWLLPAIIIATPIWLSVRHAAHANDQDAPPPAPFVIDHGILRVPEGSPLRTRLVIQPVAVSNTPHQVIVPGQVDAHPSRTVNILPAAHRPRSGPQGGSGATPSRKGNCWS